MLSDAAKAEPIRPFELERATSEPGRAFTLKAFVPKGKTVSCDTILFFPFVKYGISEGSPKQ